MKYKYYINGVEVFPRNAGAESYTYERQNDYDVLLRLTLNSEFVFNYKDQNFDFKQQQLTDKCEPLTFDVVKTCDTTTWWTGLFTIIQGKFNDDRCLYTVKPGLKEFITQDIEVNILDEPNKVDFTDPTELLTFPARTFANCLLFIAKKSNPAINSVISNFFRINPDDAFYLPITNYWSNMVMTAQSQIGNPLPSNPATLANITFQNLMNDLNTLFDVNYTIDASLNLRVEHRQYFKGIQGLDLTQDKYKSRLLGTNSFSYDVSQYVKKEVWKILDHHRQCSLTYGGLSDINKDSSTKEYNTQVIRTDYGRLINQVVTDDGIFLAALDGSNVLISNNKPLYPDFLVMNLHIYDKPAFYALLTAIENGDTDSNFTTGGGIEMKSILPSKLQEQIKIPLCCSDEFKTEDYVKTQMGNGYIDKADFDAKTSLLTLNLKYIEDPCEPVTPDQIPNLDLWLKYDTGLIYDTPPPNEFARVSQWSDSSGNGRDAVQTNFDNMPFYSVQSNMTSPPIAPLIPGNPVLFINDNQLGPPDIFTQRFLKVPAFQLFPNKRGTIFILLGGSNGSYPGFPFDSSIGELPIISTEDGVPGPNYFDIIQIDSPLRFYSDFEVKNYPKQFLPGNGLYTLRRYTNLLIDGQQNTVPSIDNPMIIQDLLPTVLDIIIGGNQNLQPGYLYNGVIFIYEIMVFGRDLSDKEIEDVQVYLTSKKIYKTYNNQF